ncbi:MAG: hypothetical protein V3T83_11830 [Acidobacteriota bacterium]
MKLERLLELKSKMAQVEDLAEAWNFFFDHFGEDPAFFQHGELAEEPKLAMLVQEIGRKVYGEKALVMPPILKRIPAYDFVHGSGLVNGHLAVVIFFKDIDMGLLSIMEGIDRTVLMRFSTFEMDGDKTVVLQSPASGKIQ